MQTIEYINSDGQRTSVLHDKIIQIIDMGTDITRTRLDLLVGSSVYSVYSRDSYETLQRRIDLAGRISLEAKE